MTTTFAPTTLAEMERRLERRRLASAQLATSLREDAENALDDPDVSDLLDSESPRPGAHERVHSLRLARMASSSARAADQALERLAAGTYGICDDCGSRISVARLRAIPEATLCVNCQARAERILTTVR